HGLARATGRSRAGSNLMLKYMPDTNIEIYTMKKKPALVRAAFKKHDGRMGNSSITSITEPSLLRHRERSVAIHDS
ncbi:MAG: hypothetical protein ACO24D_17280, partial [bacterium]